ncbi:hypothetical protein KI387_039571, partial [Taxus chinensis]
GRGRSTISMDASPPDRYLKPFRLLSRLLQSDCPKEETVGNANQQNSVERLQNAPWNSMDWNGGRDKEESVRDRCLGNRDTLDPGLSKISYRGVMQYFKTEFETSSLEIKKWTLQQENFVGTAVNGVVNVMEACTRAKSVSREGFTSSVIVACPMNDKGESEETCLDERLDEEEDRAHAYLPISSRKLLDMGFTYKYSLEESFDEGIECAMNNGILK